LLLPLSLIVTLLITYFLQQMTATTFSTIPVNAIDINISKQLVPLITSLSNLSFLPVFAMSFIFTRAEISKVFSSSPSQHQSKMMISSSFSTIASILLTFLGTFTSTFWSFHNTINTFITITMSRLIKFNSLSTILTTLLAITFYDAFFVYGTQSFTDNGQSIMETVARARLDMTTTAATVDGVAIQQQLSNFAAKAWIPGLFEVRINQQVTDALGIGDVLFPAMLGSWCRKYDQDHHSDSVPADISCFMAVSIGYILGCFMCEIFQTSQGQPALLFITPTMLITLNLHAFRKNLGISLWNYNCQKI
jgi:hypothetical protein